MPKSPASYSGLNDVHEHEEDSEVSPDEDPGTPSRSKPSSRHASRENLKKKPPFRLSLAQSANEETSLLSAADGVKRLFAGSPGTSGGKAFSRQHSIAGAPRIANQESRANSVRVRRASITGMDPAKSSSPLNQGISTMMNSLIHDDRVWYDQFTSTDWVHDSIADGHRVQALRKRKGIKGRLSVWFDASQGWLLAALIGILTACIAYFVDVAESSVFDLKQGYCKEVWYHNRRKCCLGQAKCEKWRNWSQIIRPSGDDSRWIDWTAFTLGCIILSGASCYLTLWSKTSVPSHVSLPTLDEHLAAHEDKPPAPERTSSHSSEMEIPMITYYPAAGSGVAEVKVILSGYVLHGYLGVKTLVIKTFGLVLSIASGLSLGKEGPYVHIATCIGNIACRFFPKYNLNDGKRREILSSAAASGVTVAFGAPIGGVLFSLEEVSYYFPPKVLFRTFFCCIIAALSLQFLNPYGTGKIVIFEVRYITDWRFLELFAFVIVGVLGGTLGALFIKASRVWAHTFRRLPWIKKWPMLEVAIVALITGLISFWNRHAKLPVTELLYELAAPCRVGSYTGLCPAQEDIPNIIRYLMVAFVIKAFLTTITFGIKVPAGIYVPSMVVGGLMGRIVGHTLQLIVLKHPGFTPFSSCANSPDLEACVTPGVYALVAAGATMCGVTRLSVTLAIILFELTGSLDHVLPFSLAVMSAKWTADAIEPLSIYDLLLDLNDYPFLDNKVRPVFDTLLGDISTPTKANHVIDISTSTLIRATQLREKLKSLQRLGELDGGLPILRNKKLVGLIPAPDLEFALDRLEDEEKALCRMAPDGYDHSYADDEDAEQSDPTDFTPFIDPAPVSLDINSPMDLVYQCFTKLGLRYLCVLREGEYAGLVHKKVFVKFVKEVEEEAKHPHRT